MTTRPQAIRAVCSSNFLFENRIPESNLSRWINVLVALMLEELRKET